MVTRHPTASMALGLRDYLEGCGEQGTDLGELCEMCQVDGPVARQILAALERVQLVQRRRGGRWRALPASHPANLRRRIAGLLRPRPRLRAEPPALRPKEPPSTPRPPLVWDGVRRPPWPVEEGLPALAVERCPLVVEVWEAVRASLLPPNLLELVEEVPVPRADIEVALRALAAGGLIRRGQCCFGEHSRWLFLNVEDPAPGLQRAAVEAEIMLGLLERPEPTTDSPEDPAPEEDGPVINYDEELLTPGMRALCVYDTSLDARLERAKRIAFEPCVGELPPVPLGTVWEVGDAAPSD